MPGVDDQRRVREMRAQRAQAEDVVEPLPRADRRAPGHQHLAARLEAAFRRRRGPRSYRETPRSRRRARIRAASTRPNTSGCSVSASPITSSLIQGVSKISRAICAVVTASLTLWQPAVFGSTRTPISRISRQKSCPSLQPRRLAPERHGDDLRPARAHRLGKDRGRGILRRAEHEAGAQRRRRG